MPPRPLHRWKSFWLGLLVLVFLGWAWGGSVGHQDSLLLQWNEAANLQIGQINGAMETRYYSFPHCGLDAGFYAHEVPNAKWLQPAVAIEGLEQNHTGVLISHWFLILLFLIPWIGWLVWRSRRATAWSARRLDASSRVSPP